MKIVERSALVAYSPQQMFAVVNDVVAYPEFLPWCSGARILSLSDVEMVARLDLEKAGIKQSFTTRNTWDRPATMAMNLVEGPFSHFKGVWSLQALGDVGCRVSIKLEFELNSRVMNATLGRVFSVASDKMVDAFCQRAERIYG
jgi:ribosome-associated toxin RatA of RatAB toxin-antitoxin module